MSTLDFGAALRSAHLADPASIPDLVARAAADFGATDVVVYLVDFAQTVLQPVPDSDTHPGLSASEDVSASMAGRAFATQAITTAERADGLRVWAPIVEGSDRTGVLALTVSDGAEDVLRSCGDLALFAGHLIATHARTTDIYNLHRRRRPLSLAAGMQWDLLPPLVLKTGRITVAGLLEPAYEVAGDCFDYALNGDQLNLAVFDPVGHGVASALMAALAIGSYRHDRREGQALDRMHANLDAVMTGEYPDLAFATGQLARIDIETGLMRWTNAGHPLPMLVRGGRVIGSLECPPTLPWGLGTIANDDAEVTVAEASLEPGDSVLFYTDGVVEAHAPGGEQFGSERLADLTTQHTSDQLEPEEIVRRLVAAVLEHQHDTLTDDATMVLFRWNRSHEG